MNTEQKTFAFSLSPTPLVRCGLRQCPKSHSWLLLDMYKCNQEHFKQLNTTHTILATHSTQQILLDCGKAENCILTNCLFSQAWKRQKWQKQPNVKIARSALFNEHNLIQVIYSDLRPYWWKPDHKCGGGGVIVASFLKMIKFQLGMITMKIILFYDGHSRPLNT